ncbi:MAG TPA: cytochrome c [Pyrinomonadaceae bacterium]|nr:cytochrome c [Pyrinomonadaceae bacterium]
MTLTKKAIAAGVPLALTVAGMVMAGPKPKKHQFDPAATYKSKCAGCHGATAEKKFDPTKSDDELVQIILKGKKGDKPPNMPEYETKGINADHAGQILAHMKTLRQ